MKKYILLIAFLALVVSGCATASNPPDLKSVHYSGGSLSSKEFKDCLDPSERSGYDPGDGYFGYPTRQISFDATGGKGAESDAFTVVSSDNAELYVPVTVTFNLISNCDTLKKFHETIGSRFRAYIKPGDDNNDDGETTSADYPSGWVDLLNYAIGKPLDATMDRVAQDFTWRNVWNNNAVKVQIEQAINENLSTLVDRQAGGHFFENFQVLVQKPDPVDPDLKQAISDEQAAVAQANADTAKAEADEKTAHAQEALARAQAHTKEAEIDGFGGIQNYLRYTCITEVAGCNPWQPTYLYGGSPQAAAPSQ